MYEPPIDGRDYNIQYRAYSIGDGQRQTGRLKEEIGREEDT